MKLQFTFKIEHTTNINGPIYKIHVEPYGKTKLLFEEIIIPDLESMASMSLELSLCIIAHNLSEICHSNDIVGFIDEQGKEIDIVPAIFSAHKAA